MQKYWKDKSGTSIVVNVPDTNRSAVGPLQSVSNHFLCSVFGSTMLINVSPMFRIRPNSITEPEREFCQD